MSDAVVAIVFVALLVLGLWVYQKRRRWVPIDSRESDVNLKSWHSTLNSEEHWLCLDCGFRFNFQYLQETFKPHKGIFLGAVYWWEGSAGPAMCPKCKSANLGVPKD